MKANYNLVRAALQACMFIVGSSGDVVEAFCQQQTATALQRIEFPDPVKSITSPRPDRLMPGESKPAAPANSTALAREAEVSFAQTATEPSPPQRENKNQIALQINTMPIHATVIVDDKVVGQSPLTIYVDRFTSHVVQILREGYEEKTKFIDHHFFGDEMKYIVLEKLEPKP